MVDYHGYNHHGKMQFCAGWMGLNGVLADRMDYDDWELKNGVIKVGKKVVPLKHN